MTTPKMISALPVQVEAGVNSVPEQAYASRQVAPVAVSPLRLFPLGREKFVLPRISTTPLTTLSIDVRDDAAFGGGAATGGRGSRSCRIPVQ